MQLDGRSSSGDNVRLLDYFLAYDLGRHLWGWEKGKFGFKTGKYKMPFNMARELSGREFEFTDRSMASMFFDVNRSFAWGLYGNLTDRRAPLNWEVAIFNGLVTGGAETGSSGDLDNNFAYSGRIHSYPTGTWGNGGLADFEGHCQPATRIGLGYATSTIDSFGVTEFQAIRVVDSGATLSSLLDSLPTDVSQYRVDLWACDASLKYRGWSMTCEYYFRNVGGFRGADLPDLYDHGFWFQTGKFVVPGRLQLLARWSRVVGKSGTLGQEVQSADEVAGGMAWYFRDQHAKLVFDMTNLNGARSTPPRWTFLPAIRECFTALRFNSHFDGSSAASAGVSSLLKGPLVARIFWSETGPARDLESFTFIRWFSRWNQCRLLTICRQPDRLQCGSRE